MMLAEPIPGLALLPYRPRETFDPRWLALHNRLHRCRHLPELRYRGQPLRLHWPCVAAPIERPVALALTLDDQPLRLCIPGALVELPSSVPPGLARVLLAEQALLDLIQPLEQALGGAIRVVDVGEPEGSPLPLRLKVGLTLGDAPTLGMELHLSAAVAERVLGLLESCPMQRHAFDEWPLQRRVEAGWQWLTLGELHSLEPGDVVMLDHPGNGALRLSIQDQLQALCVPRPDGLHLQQFLQSPLETPMNNEAAIAPGADTALDDLQLQLVCQLGSSQLSLAELRELGEGSVLPLAAREPDAVDLTVNGCRVGRGQLVRIGEGLGVRIISLARP